MRAHSVNGGQNGAGGQDSNSSGRRHSTGTPSFGTPETGDVDDGMDTDEEEALATTTHVWANQSGRSSVTRGRLTEYENRQTELETTTQANHAHVTQALGKVLEQLASLRESRSRSRQSGISEAGRATANNSRETSARRTEGRSRSPETRRVTAPAAKFGTGTKETRAPHNAQDAWSPEKEEYKGYLKKGAPAENRDTQSKGANGSGDTAA